MYRVTPRGDSTGEQGHVSIVADPAVGDGAGESAVPLRGSPSIADKNVDETAGNVEKPLPGGGATTADPSVVIGGEEISAGMNDEKHDGGADSEVSAAHSESAKDANIVQPAPLTES